MRIIVVILIRMSPETEWWSGACLYMYFLRCWLNLSRMLHSKYGTGDYREVFSLPCEYDIVISSSLVPSKITRLADDHRIVPKPFDGQKQNRLWYLAVLLKKQKLV